MPRDRHTPPPFESADLARSLDRYLGAGLVFMAVLIAGFLSYLVREPDLRATAKTEQAETYRSLGKDLFDKNCASCHGKGGDGGSGPVLNAKEFLAMTSDAGPERPDLAQGQAQILRGPEGWARPGSFGRWPTSLRMCSSPFRRRGGCGRALGACGSET